MPARPGGLSVTPGTDFDRSRGGISLVGRDGCRPGVPLPGGPGAPRRPEELRDAIATSGSSDVPRKDVLLQAMRELMERWYDRGA